MTEIFDILALAAGIEISGVYDCGGGAQMCLFGGADGEAFEKCLVCAKNAGFEVCAAHDIGVNRHCTMLGTCLMQLYYTPCDKSIRAVLDPNKTQRCLKPTETAGKIKLWQFEVDHSLIDCGMCYIIECGDGSFFIIDSAHVYSVNDNDRIYEFLRNRTPEGERIKIAGWFFSHGHVDHIGKFMDFLKYNTADADIECIYYNFVPVSHPDNVHWEDSDKRFQQNFEELMEKYPDIPKVTLHTGEQFCVRELVFEVLCTHEDVFPRSLKNYNDSSTVLMMSVRGAKVLFPGDAGGEESDTMVARYGEGLKCDILQAAHHGHFGVSTEFYRLASAPVILFPTTQIKYDEEFEVYEENRVAVDIADECYISSNGTVGFALPYASGSAEILPDETFEDFDGVFNLWGYEYTEQRKKELYDAYLSRR